MENQSTSMKWIHDMHNHKERKGPRPTRSRKSCAGRTTLKIVDSGWHYRVWLWLCFCGVIIFLRDRGELPACTRLYDLLLTRFWALLHINTFARPRRRRFAHQQPGKNAITIVNHFLCDLHSLKSSSSRKRQSNIYQKFKQTNKNGLWSFILGIKDYHFSFYLNVWIYNIKTNRKVCW